MQAKLPRFFSFKSASDLVRIGRNNDGGYLVSRADIDKSDVLIGLGINDDWSFEEDFKKIKNVEIFAYDASINQFFFIKRFVKTLIEITKPRRAFQRLKTALRYRIFFSNPKNHHIQKFVGLNIESDAHCTLDSILNDIKYENIFFKIDIEGSEYRLLDTLISNQNRLTGLVLELHDCDLHLKTIENFIKQFDLKLVHIHANNCGPIRLDDGLPITLELTFSRYCETQNEPHLPHRLDMPNEPKKPEIQLMIAL